ncbi:HD domain-containing protein [bacterium]|nr:HD domain-containing protein [bacterium]
MNYEKIIDEVKGLLGKNDGHGLDHILRVRDLALKFANQEKANIDIVELTCLLHDIDDYKIFGEDYANNLINANRILDNAHINSETKEKILYNIKTMGYNKYLSGIRPTTLEGKIVSDADMCDAIGAEGILRTYAYNTSRGSVFFDKTLLPEIEEKSAIKYRDNKTEHAVQHFFDKLLKIPSILMTDSGCEEGNKRRLIMIDFLRELFREENAVEWADYLNQFLKKQFISNTKLIK